MTYDESNVPTDVAQLQQLVISLSQANAELHTKLDKQTAEISKLTAELQRIMRLFEKFFNKSSQKLLQAQEDKKVEQQTMPPHCRSKFFDARVLQPDSMKVLEMIGTPYGVEKRAKKMESADRLSLRQKNSVPMPDTIFDWCRTNTSK